MRQIILDTETTGLDPAMGHRIIEIAGVELLNRRPTNRHFHRYVNPGRDSEEAALRVHGLTTEFLRDKPSFAEIAAEFLDFIRDAELIIHNAAFDVAFVNHELHLLSLEPVQACCANIVDSWKMAREMHPGKRNALDSLCERYYIDNSARTLHGALLDAQLLAEVYLAMTRGQESLIIEERTLEIAIEPIRLSSSHQPLLVVLADNEECAVHERELADIAKANGGACVWTRLQAQQQSILAA